MSSYSALGYVPDPGARRLQSSAREDWRADVRGWVRVRTTKWIVGQPIGEDGQFSAPPDTVTSLPPDVAAHLSEKDWLQLEDDG